MAKRTRGDGPNKSQSIRDAISANPTLKVKEIVALLKEQGITVAPNLVYLVKGKVKGARGQRRKTQARATRAAATAGNTDTVKTIMKVKELANEVGGYGALQKILEALTS